MKNYLINERQLKKILEQVEDDDSKDEETEESSNLSALSTGRRN